MTARTIICAALAAVLSACGGGGDAMQPATARASCTVQLLGDSTMAADEVRTALQAALDADLGAGKARVIDDARSGTKLADLLAGTAGYPVWPTAIAGDVVVANYGINDARFGSGLSAYVDGLRSLAAHRVILQSPLPILDTDTGPYADAALSVARAASLPSIDAHGWLRAQAGWQSMLPDRIHPDAATYGRLAREAQAPVVAAAVRACLAGGV